MLVKDSVSTGRWVLRYALHGKSHEMGLGSLRTYGLSEARKRARKQRQLIEDGIDPLEARRAEIAKKKLEKAKTTTVAECAEAYIRVNKAGWSAKHLSQWENTLAAYVLPLIGSLPVGAVDKELVMKVLMQPVDDGVFWTARAETASRVRGRIESILDWATVHGHREEGVANPARWKGNLQKALPLRKKMERVRHHAAMPHAEVPTFMARLRIEEGIPARALEFGILTCARVGEVLGATWKEVNLGSRMWIVPEERMKARKEWRTPLSDRAVAILEEMKALMIRIVFSFPALETGPYPA